MRIHQITSYISHITKPYPLPTIGNIKWLFLVRYLWQWLALLDFLLFDKPCFFGTDFGQELFGRTLFFTLGHELAFDGALEDAAF